MVCYFVFALLWEFFKFYKSVLDPFDKTLGI